MRWFTIVGRLLAIAADAGHSRGSVRQPPGAQTPIERERLLAAHRRARRRPTASRAALSALSLAVLAAVGSGIALGHEDPAAAGQATALAARPDANRANRGEVRAPLGEAAPVPVAADAQADAAAV